MATDTGLVFKPQPQTGAQDAKRAPSAVLRGSADAVDRC